MSALKYIVVGVGGWGGYWCRQVLPRLAELGKAEPIAVVDKDPVTFAHAKECLGVSDSQLYTNAKLAFDENKADFAIVVVPPAFHESMIDLALFHDMHVLCEKPIADSMEACCRIYRSVRKADKKMAVTMSHRFDQDKQTLEAAIKSGTYGHLHYIVSRFTNNCRQFGSWGNFRHQIQDPLLIEGTVHHFDIFRSLSGSNAKTVYAKTWNPSWGEYAGDSTGLITMEMENGVQCFYEGAKANASTMNGWGQEYFRAECEKATLEMDRRRIRALTGGSGDVPSSTEIPLLERPVWMNPWLAEQFCDWVAGGPAPANQLEDNIQCAALLFAAIQSAHTGEVVNVQSYLQNHLAQH